MTRRSSPPSQRISTPNAVARSRCGRVSERDRRGDRGKVDAGGDREPDPAVRPRPDLHQFRPAVRADPVLDFSQPFESDGAQELLDG